MTHFFIGKELAKHVASNLADEVERLREEIAELKAASAEKPVRKTRKSS